MMRYPVKITPDGDGWLVRFPDIPEAMTSGSTKEEALELAQDALETAMDFYFEDKRQVPLPSQPKRGQSVIELPANLTAKVLRLNANLRAAIQEGMDSGEGIAAGDVFAELTARYAQPGRTP